MATHPNQALRLFLAGVLSVSSLSGCTLWKVVDPELAPSGPTVWSVVEEHYEDTGRYRYVPRVAETTTGPGSVEVKGRVRVEAEKKPWFVYRGARDFHREVESVFTRGEIERVFYVTDPPGKPGGDGDPFDLGLGIIPQAKRRPTQTTWMKAPAHRFPRCALQWKVTDESGQILGFGQEIAAPSGYFDLRLSWDIVRRAAENPSPGLELILEAEDHPSRTVLRIPRDVFRAAAREVDG